MSKLKPCPCCGGEVEITKDNLMGFHVIECNICKILMYSRNKEELINKWNIRKPMQNIVERLEDATFPHNFGGEVQMMILKNKAIEIIKEEGE